MPSERIQRRIDRMLDQADEALDAGNWARVADRARDVLALDTTNEEAGTLLAAAETRLGGSAADPVAIEEPEAEPTPSRVLPDAFVSGRDVGLVAADVIVPLTAAEATGELSTRLAIACRRGAASASAAGVSLDPAATLSPVASVAVAPTCWSLPSLKPFSGV